MRMAECPPGAPCRLRGLAPGVYRVFAAEKLDPASFLDPEVRTAIWDRGKSVTVAVGVREKVELTVVAEE